MSGPDSQRMSDALASLQFMVAVDYYRNATTAHADIILPGTTPLAECHYDHYLGSCGHRNVARFSPAAHALEDAPDEWDIMLSMALALRSDEPVTPTSLAQFEDSVVAGAAARYADGVASDAADSMPLAGRDVQELVAMISPQRGVERLLDLGIRAGRWGDHFGARDGLTLAQLIAAPDGIDLGELRPRLAEVIQHADGCLDMAPAVVLDEITRLRKQPAVGGLLLIGRRNIKTNNSWLHTLPSLNKGVDVCVLEVHRDDAVELGITDAESVTLSTASGRVTVTVSLSDAIARGVVCLPHGFARANYNVLLQTSDIDAPTGTAATNAVPVTLQKVVTPQTDTADAASQLRA